MSSRARSDASSGHEEDHGSHPIGPEPLAFGEHVDPFGLEEPAHEQTPDRVGGLEDANQLHRPIIARTGVNVHERSRRAPGGRSRFGDARARTLARDGAHASVRPSVLFVCVHNAGRSQMAAALLERHAAGRVRVRSAGSEPADRLHPCGRPGDGGGRDRHLARSVRSSCGRRSCATSDVVITMGCGDACPVFPGIRYEDWELEDPAGKSLEEVRRIRDDIDERVRTSARGADRSGGKRRAERRERLRPDLEVDPLPPALPVEEPGLVEDLQVVAHRGLRQADRRRQVASACLRVRGTRRSG